MNYKIKVTNDLITDNKKIFRIGQDIAFSLLNKDTKYHDRYIGKIKDITDETITINEIEINRTRIKGKRIIPLKDIEKNSCNYVYVD